MSFLTLFSFLFYCSSSQKLHSTGWFYKTCDTGKHTGCYISDYSVNHFYITPPNSSLLFQPTAKLESVEFYLNLEHPYQGDIELILELNGIWRILTYRQGEFTDNIIAVFSDKGRKFVKPIIINDTIQPLQCCMSIWHNQLIYNREWNITIRDVFEFDVGYVRKWGLNINYTFTSVSPTMTPTKYPSLTPTLKPSEVPTHNPSQFPSTLPSYNPSMVPSVTPSVSPSDSPTIYPSISPSKYPSDNPSITPSSSPSKYPTKSPTIDPSKYPSSIPSISPSKSPSLLPSYYPSEYPTPKPTKRPTARPSVSPSLNPSINPTIPPTQNPTRNPSIPPTKFPSSQPSKYPSKSPNVLPSETPTQKPTDIPTITTDIPSITPTMNPSTIPTTIPTNNPTQYPSTNPTLYPSTTPSKYPTNSPTNSPTNLPSNGPTIAPTYSPSNSPTNSPTDNPVNLPTAVPSNSPTSSPTNTPTNAPSNIPSNSPTMTPTNTPSTIPSNVPTSSPTSAPSHTPSTTPSDFPSKNPSTTPSKYPTKTPSISPTKYPTIKPSYFPSKSPTQRPTISPTEKWNEVYGFDLVLEINSWLRASRAWGKIRYFLLSPTEDALNYITTFEKTTQFRMYFLYIGEYEIDFRRRTGSNRLLLQTYDETTQQYFDSDRNLVTFTYKLGFNVTMDREANSEIAVRFLLDNKQSFEDYLYSLYSTIYNDENMNVTMISPNDDTLYPSIVPTSSPTNSTLAKTGKNNNISEYIVITIVCCCIVYCFIIIGLYFYDRNEKTSKEIKKLQTEVNTYLENNDISDITETDTKPITAQETKVSMQVNNKNIKEGVIVNVARKRALSNPMVLPSWFNINQFLEYQKQQAQQLQAYNNLQKRRTTTHLNKHKNNNNKNNNINRNRMQRDTNDLVLEQFVIQNDIINKENEEKLDFEEENQDYAHRSTNNNSTNGTVIIDGNINNYGEIEDHLNEMDEETKTFRGHKISKINKAIRMIEQSDVSNEELYGNFETNDEIIQAPPKNLRPKKRNTIIPKMNNPSHKDLINVITPMRNENNNISNINISKMNNISDNNNNLSVINDNKHRRNNTDIEMKGEIEMEELEEIELSDSNISNIDNNLHMRGKSSEISNFSDITDIELSGTDYVYDPHTSSVMPISNSIKIFNSSNKKSNSRKNKYSNKLNVPHQYQDSGVLGNNRHQYQDSLDVPGGNKHRFQDSLDVPDLPVYQDSVSINLKLGYNSSKEKSSNTLNQPKRRLSVPTLYVHESETSYSNNNNHSNIPSKHSRDISINMSNNYSNKYKNDYIIVKKDLNKKNGTLFNNYDPNKFLINDPSKSKSQSKPTKKSMFNNYSPDKFLINDPSKSKSQSNKKKSMFNNYDPNQFLVDELINTESNSKFHKPDLSQLRDKFSNTMERIEKAMKQIETSQNLSRISDISNEDSINIDNENNSNTISEGLQKIKHLQELTTAEIIEMHSQDGFDSLGVDLNELNEYNKSKSSNKIGKKSRHNITKSSNNFNFSKSSNTTFTRSNGLPNSKNNNSYRL